MNGCLKDIYLVKEFVSEHISMKALSADDHIVLGMTYNHVVLLLCLAIMMNIQL